MRPNDSSNWSNSSISKKGTTSMRQRLLRVMMPGILAVAAVTLAACGSDSSDSSTDTSDAAEQFAAVTEAPDDAQQGGDLTVIAFFKA